MYKIELEMLKKNVFEKLHEINQRDLEVNIKQDRSPVTEFDLFISKKVKEIFTKRHPDFHFYSEEDPESFDFPAIVVDPLDGTREFVKGFGECCVSLAILYSKDIDDRRNYGWIYNPFTGFEISNDLHIPIEQRKNIPSTIHVMVSRSEWDKNLVDHEFGRDICVTPMGSIALKLGMLGAGACDIVISTRDKNVWDIAAGILICHSRGIRSYSKGKEILSLDRTLFHGEFIWGKDREIELFREQSSK